MKQKNMNLDVERLVASFMIVAIHIYPFSSINENLDYMITRVLFRIAVPLFLMITGYYILTKSMKDIHILKNYTKKILKLYLISIVIFLPINFYNHYFTDNNIFTILKDIFINGTFYHLWYFPSLIMGIWSSYFLIKNANEKTVPIILILLFVIGLFGDNYYGLISNIPILKNFYQAIFSLFDYTRNGLFYTPIFIYFGYKLKMKKCNLSFKKNIVYILISALLMLIEGAVLYTFKIPRHSSMYIFLLPLSYYLFNLFVVNYNGENKRARNYATWLYILHPLFIIIVRFIAKLVHLDILYSNSLTNYILVVLLTLIFIYIVNKVKEVKNEKRIING